MEQLSKEIIIHTDAADAGCGAAPATRSQLQTFLQLHLAYSVPDRALCAGHSSPMDYLWHTYSCDLPGLAPGEKHTSGDCLVWANRGGGKTQLAAIATLLEGLFKPGCQTTILAGSLDQSSLMYEYVCHFVEPAFVDRLAGKMLKESCRFKNGTTVKVLAQSSRSVRGRHIHKLRCDEVELFDMDVFNAAKFITRSSDTHIGAMEMLSTMHRPYGLMQKLIDLAPECHTPVFKWCMWEVIERCTEDRSCSRCPLNSDCGGKARRANGYLKIDDCIAQMRRSSRAGFESEMLCLRPCLENAVFDRFDPRVHVAEVCYDATLPLYRAMDFGFTNPFVCLWIQIDREGTVRVIDEYVQKQLRIHEHARAVIARTPCNESQVKMTYCDPAGAGRNGVSGTSEVTELRELGMRIAYRKSEILEGIELIRAYLHAGDGSHRFVVDSRCQRMIEALRCYHYPDTPGPSELPKKDGKHDHPIDALRYFFVNFFAPVQKPQQRY
jgi:hypothetical protein